MPKRNYIVGLDIGSTAVRVVVGQSLPDLPQPRIIGASSVPAEGMRRGVVADRAEAAESIVRSVQQAERLSGIGIDGVYAGVGGDHIMALPSRGVVAVSRADGEVAEDDIERVHEAAKAVSLPTNREILHVVPHEYVVDGETDIKDAVGMSGVRLEANTLIIGGATPHLKNLYRSIEDAGLRIYDFVLFPLATAKAVLSKRQKELGVVCLDIGGGTTGLSVFEEGKLLHTRIIPLGGSHITNDLAIGLRTSVDVAEQVKRQYGAASAEDISKRENIELSSLDPAGEGAVPRREMAEIIEARLSEIFDLCNKELRQAGKEAFLPAGVVLIGGVAKTAGIVDLCKEKMRLPAQVGFPRNVEGIVESVDDPAFSAGVGLVLWGLEEEGGGGMPFFPVFSPFNKTLSRARKWFRTFLP